MSNNNSLPPTLRRRGFMLGASALGSMGGLASVLAHAQAPAVVRSDAARPTFPSGVQSGDVNGQRGIVWARSDRPARMWVEWSTTPSWQRAVRVRGPHALESTD